MDKKTQEILCKVTEEHTFSRLVAILRKAMKESDEYTSSLLSITENQPYEYEYINEIEEATLDDSLISKLEDIEEILKCLLKGSNKLQALQRAFKEFSNGSCNGCKDYLDLNTLKKTLKKVLTEKGCTENIDSIIDIWVKKLFE